MARRIDALFEETYDDDGPGAAVIVVKSGEMILRKGYGLADLEHRVPITPETVFRLDAVTAQFTAMAILMLEEDGKLSTDDPITEFLPDYPMGEEPITVAHLLSHTSGIKNYGMMPQFWRRSREDLSTSELTALFRNEPLEFTPGDRYQFSSSNYVLLGVIIEKVSGLTYEEFLRRRIFRPLGMNSTYYDRHSAIIRHRAAGYGRYEEGYYNADIVSAANLYSAAGLASTVDDLMRWDAALYSEELVSREALDRYFTPFSLNDGTPCEYTYGWWRGTLQGRPAYHHYGWVSGFMCKVVRLPEDQTYVAILSNYPESEPSVFYLADRAAAIAIGRPFREWKAVSLPPEVLDRYVGVYRVDENTVRYVTREGDRLFTQRSGWPRLEPRPASETVFFYPKSTSYFEFVLDDEGCVTHMVMHQQGRDELAVRTAEPLPEPRQAVELDPTVFDRYVGTYEFDSGYRLSVFRKVTRQRVEEKQFGFLLPGVRFTVFRAIDRFMAESGYGPMEIFPESETSFFFGDHSAELVFKLAEDGSVDSVVLRNARGEEEFGSKVE